MRRVRVRVRGHVQGVFFRAETHARARSLGVGGYARNLYDGSLECVFEGRPEAVESMLDWCRRGPRGARVDDVSVEDEEPRGDEGFSVD